MSEFRGHFKSQFHFYRTKLNITNTALERIEKNADNPQLARTHLESYLALKNGDYINEWMILFFNLDPLRDELEVEGERQIVRIKNKRVVCTYGNVFDTLGQTESLYNITIRLGEGEISDHYAEVLMRRNGIVPSHNKTLVYKRYNTLQYELRSSDPASVFSFIEASATTLPEEVIIERVFVYSLIYSLLCIMMIIALLVQTSILQNHPVSASKLSSLTTSWSAVWIFNQLILQIMVSF